MIPSSVKQIHKKEFHFEECLKAGFDLWRANFSTLTLIFASLSLPVTLINHLISTQLSGTPLVLIQSALKAVALILSAMASARVIESYLLKDRLSYTQAIKSAAQNLVRGLVVGILFEAGLIVSSLFLLAPGVVFMIYFGFALPSVILRNTHGFDAFLYSYNLTKKRLSPLFVKFLGVGLLVFLCWLLTVPLILFQSTTPHLLSGILFHVLFSFPTLVTIVMYLNYDYLDNGFSGQLEEDTLNSEVSQYSLKPGDLAANSLTALREKAVEFLQNKESPTFQKGPLKIKNLREFLNRFLKDKNKKQLEDLLKAEVLNPKDMRLKQKIAETLYRMGQTDEAANVYLDIANQFENENFLIKAIKFYKNILQIKPDLIEINLKLSGIYEKMNMPLEASNQLRIAISVFAMVGNKEKTIELSEKLVKIDASYENQTKLAEIYQMNGMKAEALKAYENLSQRYRAEKKYDKLLHIYELILPHKAANTGLIKDICILHLRNQNPTRCLQVIDQYKLSQDENFKELVTKAQMMFEAIKRKKTN